MTEYTLFIPGIPAPKGSKSFKGMRKRKDGRSFATLVESSKKVAPWQKAVIHAVFDRQRITGEPAPFFAGAVRMSALFLFARPKSVGKRTPAWSNALGDLDKLMRATKDAITAAGIWCDASQVIGYDLIDKRYCEAGEMPGCQLRLVDPYPGAIKPQAKGKEHGIVRPAVRPLRPARRGGGDTSDLFAPERQGSPEGVR
jgi:Holliday junction resolvase RusA-like endonuclease